jgi:UDP-N-acetylglucosamine transferase subunit ALG13
MSVLHQTGESQVDAVKGRYRELGVDAEVVPFIDDMARAYASASLVIARAGATTLAELCAIGKPSILIPYPHAAEDHQMKNARAMEQAGAALAISESALSAEGLAKQVRALLVGRSERQAMADAARTLGRPEAAAAIVDDLCTYLGVPVDGGTGTGGQGESYPQGSADSGARSSAQVSLSSLEIAAQSQTQSAIENAFAADGVSVDAAEGLDAAAPAHYPYQGMLTRPAVRKPRVRRAPLRVRAVDHALVH